MKVLYHLLAREDVVKILEYYESEAGGDVAVEFFSDLNQSIRSIARYPRAFPEIKTGIRRCLLRRFPYQINFEIVDEGKLKILVVKHQNRRPNLGIDRN